MSPTIRSLLSNRNFVLLWCAYGISAMGDHLSEMAILATQDALDPSVDITPLQSRMMFVFMLPFFVLGSITGALADRLPRRWVMIAADLVRVGIMLTFLALITSFSDQFGRGWGPYLPLGLVGVFAVLFSPARAAMVPVLVPAKELIPANALIGGLGMIGTLFAAVVGGELADRGLIRTAFNLDACTFLLSAVCVFLISSRRGVIAAPRRRQPGSVLASIGDGARYIVRHRRVVQLIGVAVVFWFSAAAVRCVTPAIVKDVYGGGFAAMAWFPAWIGLGMATGAVLMAIAGNALRGDVTITWCLFGAGMGVLGMGISAFMGLAPRLAHVTGAVSIFVGGVFSAGLIASYNAMLQRFVRDRYRGRVFGVLNVATVGGLLLATGVLAIPQWENLDRWAGYILLLIAGLLLGVGGLTLAIRLGRAPFGKEYAGIRNFIEFVVKFWYGCERIGPCTVPRSGPVIITTNHECAIDPFLILGTCNYRLISFMIAAEYNRNPIIKHITRSGRNIPVRRGENDISATKTAIRRLRNKGTVGIFIQGGIRSREREDQLKNGVAILALRTGATVIPAHINYLTGPDPREGMLWSFLKRRDTRITYGKAVDLSEFAGGKGQRNLEGASRRIFAAINDLAPK